MKRKSKKIIPNAFDWVLLINHSRIPSAEYWNPENKEIKAQNLPTFIDIIGLETSLSESKEEISVNKELMRLIINGQLPQNCDLFDLSNKLKNREKINIKPDLQIAAVDIIIVVLSAENYVTPDILLYDICKEAKFETKSNLTIPFSCYKKN